MLIKSKYKTTAEIFREEEYTSFRAVDIEDRNKTEYIINMYENRISRRYADCYTRLRHCGDFKEVFLHDGRLFSVFGLHGGDSIDKIFSKGSKHSWKERVDYAHSLFHLALSVSDFPYEFACAALLSRNMRVTVGNAPNKKIAVNYTVSPLENANFEQFKLLFTEQVRKIFCGRFTACDAELEFMEFLSAGGVISMARLYSAWLTYRKRITEEYEVLYSKKGFDKIMSFVIMNVRRSFKKHSPVKF